MKAISGAKLKPTDQGPLAGALKDLGFDESQVCCAPSDVVMVADPMRTGVQILEGWLMTLLDIISIDLLIGHSLSLNLVPPLM